VPTNAVNDPTAHKSVEFQNTSALPGIVFNSGDTFTAEVIKANAGFGLVAQTANVGVEKAQLAQQSVVSKTIVPAHGIKHVQFHGGQTHNYFTYGFVVGNEYMFIEENKYMPANAEITLKKFDEKEVVRHVMTSQTLSRVHAKSPEDEKVDPPNLLSQPVALSKSDEKEVATWKQE